MALLNPDDFPDSMSVEDYLVSKGYSEAMIKMAAAGFSNTLCTNSRDLSLKQCIKWLYHWHEEEGEDGDFCFDGSFKVLVDGLKRNVQIETGQPVVYMRHPGLDDKQGDLVMLRTASGTTYYAKTVVLTANPVVLRSGIVKFEPEFNNEIKEAFNSVNLHRIIKVFMKFSKRPWPRHLSGMIMVDDNFLLPEIWFRDVTGKTSPDEAATCYAVGFTTADYEAKVAALPKSEVLKRSLAQLDEIFSYLKPEHMNADLTDADIEKPADLPKPSDVCLGGMFWDWNAEHHPYIGGGYCSSKVNTSADTISRLMKPYGKHVFFAGEATNMPGATAHAALESGDRAADNVCSSLKELD